MVRIYVNTKLIHYDLLLHQRKLLEDRITTLHSADTLSFLSPPPLHRIVPRSCTRSTRILRLSDLMIPDEDDDEIDQGRFGGSNRWWRDVCMCSEGWR